MPSITASGASSAIGIWSWPSRSSANGIGTGEAVDEAAAAETRAAIAWALGQLLHLLHPFMPFITEELWQQVLGGKDPLIVAPWPRYTPAMVDAIATADLDWVIELVSEIRALRSEMNVPEGALIPAAVRKPAASPRSVSRSMAS